MSGPFFVFVLASVAKPINKVVLEPSLKVAWRESMYLLGKAEVKLRNFSLMFTVYLKIAL